MARRVGTIIERFGVTPAKMVRALDTYQDITARHGCTPTFPITTVALERNPRVAQRLNDRGAELAIHGYVHVDYASLSLEEQRRHIQRACRTFERHAVPFVGFRCPYYRWNEATWQVAEELGFLYSSNRVAHWDCFDESMLSSAQQASYRKAIDLYSSREASSEVVLPFFRGGLVEIPASIPDDEALVERMGFASSQDKAQVWCDMLGKIYDRGELFCLSLHPERIYQCQEALDAVLAQARTLSPSVWIAPLREIAEWWKEKQGFTLTARETSAGHYAVRAEASARATLLVRGASVSGPAKDWYAGYVLVDGNECEIESHVKPFVGVPLHAPEWAVAFLADEGYIVERSADKDSYGTYLDRLEAPVADGSEERAKKLLLDTVESSGSPLVRLWRWPNGARCCLSVTGDIDSLTLVDFGMRMVGA